MTIHVLYFASLREKLGRVSDAIELPQSKSFMTAETLWCLTTKYNDFPDDVLIAINQEYKEKHDAVKDGDEVAFFPPVTGG